MSRHVAAPADPPSGQDGLVPPASRLAAAAYAALAVTDTVLAGSRSAARRRLRLITKPLLMPALGTAYAASLREMPPEDSARNRGGLLQGGTVAAQALSGVGDIALLSRSEPAFLTGLSSFFGAHIAYSTAFVSAGRPLEDRSADAGPIAAGAFFAVAGPTLGWAAGRRSARLRAPVTAYAGIISTMFAASTRLEEGIPADARRAVIAGTSLFVLSDTVIGLRKFVMKDPQPRSDAVVMATYTAGQGLIAYGVAKAVRARAARAPKHRAV